MEQIAFNDLCHFTDKQKEAQLAVEKYKFTLYGGAMGGGKSYWLRWQLLRLLMELYAKEGIGNVTAGLFCEDYPALKDRHLSKVKYEFPAWLGIYNSSDHNFILAPEYGGSVIAFRNLDDPSKYQSSEFAYIAVDEITKNGKDVFDFLRTRLRWPGIKDVKFIAATNPGGTGHVWVKDYWINKKYGENEQEAEGFTYIQAKAKDNPHINPEYLKTLASLPEDTRRAFLEGDWDIFKGQYFTEFRRDVHVISPRQVLTHYKKFVCGDYGYAKPSAIYWCYTDGDGNVFVYRELYQTGLTYEQLMKSIISMTLPQEEISYMVFDPAIWSKHGESDLSGAEIMEGVYKKIKNKGVVLLRGDNNRIIGWNLLREYLRPIYGQIANARLQIFSTCTELIRTIPSLIYDETKIEDLDTDGEDHGADALRYGIMSRPPTSQSFRTPIDKIFSRTQTPTRGKVKITFE